MIYTFNDFELDTDLFELRYQGKQRMLEPQVYQVLTYLLVHRNRTISKQELFDKLWKGRMVTESSLSTSIKEARRAINDNGRDQHSIATVHRRGYRFIANVKEEPTPQPDNALINPSFQAYAGNSGEPVDDQLSLVVCPFKHNPNDLEAAWWAEIFSEDISIYLARMPGFKVISRYSVMALGKDQGNAQKIGQQLNTQYTVTESIQNFKKAYRISIQLIASR
jgi:DNA-binding winged helix-turn-helix (wHTH) protein